MKKRKISILLTVLALSGTMATGCSRIDQQSSDNQTAAVNRTGIVVDEEKETEKIVEQTQEELPFEEIEEEKEEKEAESGAETEKQTEAENRATIVFSSMDEEETELPALIMDEPTEEEDVFAEEPMNTASGTFTIRDADEMEGDLPEDYVNDSLEEALFEENEEVFDSEEVSAQSLLDGDIPLSPDGTPYLEFEEAEDDEAGPIGSAVFPVMEEAAGVETSANQIELEDVTVNLPDSWTDHYTTVNFGEATIFYQKECKEAGEGGHLFTIEKFTNSDYEMLNSYEILASNGTTVYVIEYPVEEQFGSNMENQELYSDMSLDIPTIIRDLSFAPGYETTLEEEEPDIEEADGMGIDVIGNTLPEEAAINPLGPVEEYDAAPESVLPLGENSTLTEYSDQITQEMNALAGDAVFDTGETNALDGAIAPIAETDTTAADSTSANANEVRTDAETGYVLKESATRLYTEAELAGMSAWELRVARNEIYARHGRKFKDQSLQEYFNGCSWYNGTIEADVFETQEAGVLSSTEKANVEMIYAVEGKPALGAGNSGTTAGGTTTPAASVQPVTVTIPAAPTTQTTPATGVDTNATGNYVVDKQNLIVHTENCDDVTLISPDRYGEETDSINNLRLKGYISCTKCIG